MSPQDSTRDSKRSIAGWHFVVVGAVAVAAATLIALPTWSAMPGEATAAATESDALGARQADQLAQQHGAWMREAHQKANGAAEAQPLPAQF